MKEEVIDGFNKDNGYIKTHNFKIIDLNNEECTVEYIVNDDGLNPIKIAHGGLLFGLADTTAGALACMTGKYPLTINSDIHFLNTAKCNKLISKASILKIGNNIGYFKVDIHDENKNLICTCTIDMYLKKIDK